MEEPEQTQEEEISNINDGDANNELKKKEKA